jgi:hypothetical protein
VIFLIYGSWGSGKIGQVTQFIVQLGVNLPIYGKGIYMLEGLACDKVNYLE